MKMDIEGDSPPSPESEEEVDAQKWKPHRAEYLIIACLTLLSLMAAFDNTILVPALPTIARALNGTAVDAFWAGTSYLLTSAVFQPFIASLSDIFGRRELLLVAVLFFTSGTAIACSSNDFPQLLAGRSIQGVGGGGIIAMVLVIFTDIIPLRQRPSYYAIIQIAWAVGTISGPVIGGAFSKSNLWRWVFYINFPFCGIGLLTVPFVLKLNKRKQSLMQKIRRVDFMGGLLFIGGSASFLIGLTWGGNQFSWQSVHVLVPLFVGIAAIATAVTWEIKGAIEPFLRLSLFKNRSAVLAYSGGVIQGIILFGEGFYGPLFLESVKNFSPVLTGVAMLPITGGILPTTAICGIIITKTGKFRWAIWTGWLLTTVATGLLILIDATTPSRAWISIFIFVGIGHGFILGPCLFAAQAASSGPNVAYATALYTFFRTVGMCLGVALCGTVFQNLLSHYLRQNNLPASIATNAAAFVTELQALPEDSTFRLSVVAQYTKAFHGVMATLTGFAGLGGLLSLGIRDMSMDVNIDSGHQVRQTRAISA